MEHRNFFNKDEIGYYLDGILAAAQPTKVWSLPGVKKGGIIKYTVPIGLQIGRIFSWVKDSNGATWFQLVAPETKPENINTAKIIGYTPYIPNQFNKELVYNTSSGKKLDDFKKSIDEMTTFKNPLSVIWEGFSSLIKKLIIVVVIFIALYIALKVFTK